MWIKTCDLWSMFALGLWDVD